MQETEFWNENYEYVLLSHQLLQLFLSSRNDSDFFSSYILPMNTVSLFYSDEETSLGRQTRCIHMQHGLVVHTSTLLHRLHPIDTGAMMIKPPPSWTL
jgi:hypothetical protein